MTYLRYTSRTAQFRRRVSSMLGGAGWPPAASGLVPVLHHPAGPDGNPYELVFVERGVGITPEFTESGIVGREEILTATIVIDARRPGWTADQATDRAEELSDVVQRLFYDYETFVPATIGIDGEYVSAQVTRTEVTPYPTGAHGHGCVIEIDLQVRADI